MDSKSKLKRLELPNKRAVYFTKPRLVAYYEKNYESITPAERICYLKVPKWPEKYPIDLNTKYSTFISREFVVPKKLHLCLKYAMSSSFENDAGVDNIGKTKVFAHKGVLVEIMRSYYVNQHVNPICVSRYNGNIYMTSEKNEEEYPNELESVRTHHSCLEKLLFADTPNDLPKSNERCDENIKLIGIYRSNFGKYDVIYSGAIQGLLSNEEFKDFNDLNALNDCRFVMVKQMWSTLKKKDTKYLNYWLQAYLSNVRDIYFAYKNSGGVVEEPIVHEIVNQLPKGRNWKPSVCTSILYEFLERVEMLMSDVNSLNMVYVFNYNPQDLSISYEKNYKSFIPEDYIKYCNK